MLVDVTQAFIRETNGSIHVVYNPARSPSHGINLSRFRRTVHLNALRWSARCEDLHASRILETLKFPASLLHGDSLERDSFLVSAAVEQANLLQLNAQSMPFMPSYVAK